MCPVTAHSAAEVTDNDTVAHSWAQLAIVVGFTIAVMLVITYRSR